MYYEPNLQEHGDIESIVIRPLASGEVATVQQVFDGMSPESRYHRFMQAMPRLTSSMLRLLSEVDGTRHRAWGAFVGDRPVGVVRVVVDSMGDHELSVAVVDEWHRRGVGRRLVQHAMSAAARDGIDDLVVMIHPENAASITLFRSLGARYRFDFGVLVGRVPVRVLESVAA